MRYIIAVIVIMVGMNSQAAFLLADIKKAGGAVKRIEPPTVFTEGEKEDFRRLTPTDRKLIVSLYKSLAALPAGELKDHLTEALRTEQMAVKVEVAKVYNEKMHTYSRSERRDPAKKEAALNATYTEKYMSTGFSFDTWRTRHRAWHALYKVLSPTRQEAFKALVIAESGEENSLCTFVIQQYDILDIKNKDDKKDLVPLGLMRHVYVDHPDIRDYYLEIVGAMAQEKQFETLFLDPQQVFSKEAYENVIQRVFAGIDWGKVKKSYVKTLTRHRLILIRAIRQGAAKARFDGLGVLTEDQFSRLIDSTNAATTAKEMDAAIKALKKQRSHHTRVVAHHGVNLAHGGSGPAVADPAIEGFQQEIAKLRQEAKNYTEPAIDESAVVDQEEIKAGMSLEDIRTLQAKIPAGISFATLGQILQAQLSGKRIHVVVDGGLIRNEEVRTAFVQAFSPIPNASFAITQKVGADGEEEVKVASGAQSISATLTIGKNDQHPGSFLTATALHLGKVAPAADYIILLSQNLGEAGYGILKQKQLQLPSFDPRILDAMGQLKEAITVWEQEKEGEGNPIIIGGKRHLRYDFSLSDSYRNFMGNTAGNVIAIHVPYIKTRRGLSGELEVSSGKRYTLRLADGDAYSMLRHLLERQIP